MVNYLAVVQRPLALVRRDTVIWANSALSDLVSMSIEDLVDGPIPIAGGLNFDKLRRSSTEAALRHASGYLLDVVVTTTLVTPPDTWMLEFAMADYEDERSSDHLRKLQMLADNLPVGVMISEAGLRLGYVNNALADLLDCLPAKLLGTGWLGAFAEGDRDKLRSLALTALTGVPVRTILEIPHGVASVMTLDLSLIPVVSRDTSVSFIGTVTDVTERVALESRLSYEIDHDALTGLKNRRGLESDIDAKIRELQEGELASLLVGFCDIDHLRAINDTLGHSAGDHVLVEVANRLRATALPAYRLAGDEFIVIAADSAVDQAALKAKLQQILFEPITVGTAKFVTSGSIGVIEVNPGDSSRDVIRKTDQAIYAREQKGTDVDSD